MGILAKSSLAFVCSNAIRFLTVLALCLAIAGNVLLMVKNIQAFQDSSSSVTPISNQANSNSTFAATSSPIPSSTTSAKPKSTSGARVSDTSEKRLVRVVRAKSEDTSNEAVVSPQSAVSVQSSVRNDFVDGTDVPTSPGAIFFISLTFILQTIVLFFLILTEIPPPPFKRLLESLFPPLFFSSTLSMFLPGIMYIYLSSSLLSHSDLGNVFVTVAGWFLFVAGAINFIFLGVISWMAGIDVRSMRSLFENTKSSSSSTYSTKRAASSKYASSDTSSQVSVPQMVMVSGSSTVNYGEKPRSIDLRGNLPYGQPIQVGGGFDGDNVPPQYVSNPRQ